MAGIARTAARAAWPSADETAEAIERDHQDHPSDAIRWLLQARDQLLEAPNSQAEVLWKERHIQLSDARWETLLRAITAATFRKKLMTPPTWAQPTPIANEWTPLTRIPIRPTDLLDPGLREYGIRIRAKDLTTR